MFDDVSSLEKISKELKEKIIIRLNSRGGGHYGGSLSVLDILITLYYRVIDLNDLKNNKKIRDKIILSKGHASISLYSILHSLELISDKDYESYGIDGSVLSGHPDMLCSDLIEFSTGSLGQGLSAAIGMALILKQYNKQTWTILGDGECQEGQIWEAASLAPRYKLGNVNVILDSNKFQEYGWYKFSHIDMKEPLPNPAEKWRAFGWHVLEVDGHNFNELLTAMKNAQSNTLQPSIIIAHTIKGKGIPQFEKDPFISHCTSLAI
ncbi:transketolase [Acinetobacter baumannii]|nr:transketolase [Acinetobacter baumannii]